jgi:hypothetical protein
MAMGEHPALSAKSRKKLSESCRDLLKLWRESASVPVTGDP